MSTSTAKHDSYLVEDWDTETLIDFLKKQNLKLDDKKHYDVLHNREIDGQVFIDMSKEDFMQAGLEMGPAMKLAKEAKVLKEKPKRSFFSYKTQKDLSEVLAKYEILSGDITLIPQFKSVTHPIDEDASDF